MAMKAWAMVTVVIDFSMSTYTGSSKLGEACDPPQVRRGRVDALNQGGNGATKRECKYRIHVHLQECRDKPCTEGNPQAIGRGLTGYSLIEDTVNIPHLWCELNLRVRVPWDPISDSTSSAAPATLARAPGNAVNPMPMTMFTTIQHPPCVRLHERTSNRFRFILGLVRV